jgi:hypothetical protein
MVISRRVVCNLSYRLRPRRSSAGPANRAGRVALALYEWLPRSSPEWWCRRRSLCDPWFELEGVEGGTQLASPSRASTGCRPSGATLHIAATPTDGRRNFKPSRRMSVEAANDDLARIQLAARPIFAALGDDARLRLVTRLASEGPMSIVRLSHGSGLTRQAITKHLRVLAKVGSSRARGAGGRACGRSTRGHWVPRAHHSTKSLTSGMPHSDD